MHYKLRAKVKEGVTLFHYTRVTLQKKQVLNERLYLHLKYK